MQDADLRVGWTVWGIALEQYARTARHREGVADQAGRQIDDYIAQFATFVMAVRIGFQLKTDGVGVGCELAWEVIVPSLLLATARTLPGRRPKSACATAGRTGSAEQQ